MRTDVKLGIGLGLAVVLVASLFFFQSWNNPGEPTRPEIRNEPAMPGPPESSVRLPSESEQNLAATIAPPDEHPSAPRETASAPTEDPLPEGTTDLAALMAQFDAAGAEGPAGSTPPAEPSAVEGYRSPDPASVAVIRPAVEEIPYPGGEQPPAVPLEPSVDTELVSDPVEPAAAPPVIVPPAPAAAGAVTPAPAVPAQLPATYTVQPGDSFWAIAQRLYGDGNKHALLAAANATGDRLRPGQVLTVPRPHPDALPPAAAIDLPAAVEVPGPQPDQYVVQPGDSLWSIAVKLYNDGTRSKAIFQANRDRLTSENALKVGQTLRLPTS
jgi:nucleoid-associated protein YgaU